MPLPLVGAGVAQFGHANSPALRAAPHAVQVSEVLGVIRVDRRTCAFYTGAAITVSATGTQTTKSFLHALGAYAPQRAPADCAR